MISFALKMSYLKSRAATTGDVSADGGFRTVAASAQMTGSIRTGRRRTISKGPHRLEHEANQTLCVQDFEQGGEAKDGNYLSLTPCTLSPHKLANLEFLT